MEKLSMEPAMRPDIIHSDRIDIDIVVPIPLTQPIKLSDEEEMDFFEKELRKTGISEAGLQACLKRLRYFQKLNKK